MPSAQTTHNQLIREEFTKQAQAYAANPTIQDPDWAMRLVTVAQPKATDQVLEVATGPGYVALAFAAVVQDVVGVDLTAAPLAIAEQNRQERALENIRFETADAYQLPFAENSFDIVVCRLAVHHFIDPEQALAEMARVCRLGGKLVIEDLVASEHSSRADYYNHWEQLRDPSHVTALSLSRFLTIYTRFGLETVHIKMEDRTQVVEQWLRNAQTPPDMAEQVRQLLTADLERELSGIHVFHDQAGELCFDHRMATVVGQKIDGSIA